MMIMMMIIIFEKTTKPCETKLMFDFVIHLLSIIKQSNSVTNINDFPFFLPVTNQFVKNLQIFFFQFVLMGKFSWKKNWPKKNLDDNHNNDNLITCFIAMNKQQKKQKNRKKIYILMLNIFDIFFSVVFIAEQQKILFFWINKWMIMKNMGKLCWLKKKQKWTASKEVSNIDEWMTESNDTYMNEWMNAWMNSLTKQH